MQKDPNPIFAIGYLQCRELVMRISSDADFIWTGSDAHIKYFLYPVSQLIYYAFYPL